MLLRQATKQPSSTPPVVPGAALASAKAGVGGYINIYIYINYTNYLDMEEGTQNHKPVEALLPRLQCQMSGPF